MRPIFLNSYKEIIIIGKTRPELVSKATTSLPLEHKLQIDL